MMTIPDQLQQLIERFDAHLADYKQGKYNETQVRREFIDPLFTALGWDVANVQGYAEAYKEVVHEDAIKVGRATKAPDYSFRIGGVRKFFVEAKKPSVYIKEDIHPAYQLRRYAWSAKLPLSILTDFEEFAVYDCRVKPEHTDKASTARIMYLTFTEYAQKWEELIGIFSKEAILKSAFDRYAESTKTKKGTAEVDVAFLQEIERWRDLLARNLALRNPQLTRRDLNFAVQRTIDRIIFLRICEDRGVETYGKLQALLNGANVYARLLHLFYQADDRYNSGIFHFKTERDHAEAPDGLTPTLQIDDKVLKDILNNLYYPDSPYEFSVLPADILGQVYEQFLGKVICLTDGHQAKVEEKPEVKKAGGVYYTPTYIVEYIVKNTVGKLLEEKTLPGFKTLAGLELTILDPACGSGSFLIGAYQYLLDWYRAAYLADPAKWSTGRPPRLYRNAQGEWKLTVEERKRILLSHIYGVDIDAQAVEVTKLSLLLKVLEGEDEQTINSQLTLFQKRVLPDLSNNIKCGNSLIGSDFYVGKQMTLLDEEEMYRVNVFDWDKEFPEIIKQGGFDAVVGNPPYLFITELNKPDKEYFFKCYKTSEYRFDVYGLFTELAVCSLVKCNGYMSFIIPHTLLSNDSFEKLRRLMLDETFLEHVVDIGPGVFQTAKNETMIFVVRNGYKPETNKTTHVLLTTSKTFPQAFKEFFVDSSIWRANKGSAWIVNMSENESQVMTKIEACLSKLGELCTINQGLRTGDNEKYLSEIAESDVWKSVVGGKHIGRYEPLVQETYVYYEPSVLDAPRRKEIFESAEKIVVQEIRNITLPRRIIATYDAHQFYCLQSTNVINLRKDRTIDVSIKFLLGILNSNTVNFYFHQRFSGNNHIASNQLAQIPVPSADRIKCNELVKLVEQMLALHKQLAEAYNPQAHTLLQRQIDATDRQIDRLVYELYDLTEEEIEIVEQS